MRTLGFSVGHDKGAVIIENGKVVIGITQERYLELNTIVRFLNEKYR
jgi:predicted NodU family carbamoyl transferase